MNNNYLNEYYLFVSSYLKEFLPLFMKKNENKFYCEHPVFKLCENCQRLSAF
jgi:hypothetical protein